VEFKHEIPSGTIVRVGKDLFIVERSFLTNKKRPGILLMSTTYSNSHTHMDNEETVECPKCEGTGFAVSFFDASDLPVFDKSKQCPICHGTKVFRNSRYIGNIEIVADCMQDFIMQRIKDLFFGT